MTRKRRGMRTQMLIAKRWKALGLFPHAVDAGAGRQGKDVLNTPGLYTEIKARGRLTLLETLRQAEKGAGEDELPIVVWRHDGQGEKGIGMWTVTVRLPVFEQLWEVWVNGERGRSEVAEASSKGGEGEAGI